MSDDYQGWHALFVDGPMAEGENDRHFTGNLPAGLYFAPSIVKWASWTLVGSEPGNAPIQPWDGQVKYVAVDEIEPWPVGEPQVVRFRLESEA